LRKNSSDSGRKRTCCPRWEKHLRGKKNQTAKRKSFVKKRVLATSQEKVLAIFRKKADRGGKKGNTHREKREKIAHCTGGAVAQAKGGNEGGPKGSFRKGGSQLDLPKENPRSGRTRGPNKLAGERTSKVRSPGPGNSKKGFRALLEL